jgi:hypothetical protein
VQQISQYAVFILSVFQKRIVLQSNDRYADFDVQIVVMVGVIVMIVVAPSQILTLLKDGRIVTGFSPLTVVIKLFSL